MEKLAYYWKRLRQNRLAYNLVLIGAIILAMAVAAHIVMQVGTRHGARRTVPDFSGVKLDQAQRMARKYDLKLHINDSLFVPAYEGGTYRSRCCYRCCPDPVHNPEPSNRHS